MRIYHGSLEKVENPEIRVPNRTLDYGSGFYATTSYEQALGWVYRRMDDTGVKSGYVNVPLSMNLKHISLLTNTSFIQDVRCRHFHLWNQKK